MSAYVYRAFDGAGRLLYVGSSMDADARIRQHEGSPASAWTLYTDRWEIEEFATMEEASTAEVRAILTEHPRWNIKERHPDHPDGFATSVAGTYWLKAERDLAADVADLRYQAAKIRGEYQRVAAELRLKEALVQMVKDGTHDLTVADITEGGAA